MPPAKPIHPIRRIRQALKASPEEIGLRQYATSAGFAKFLGRSSSLIRNVECGITTNWTSLAEHIEDKTRVSCEWLLSQPGPESPILDIGGRPWNPVRELDPLRPRQGMLDWRLLLNTCPGTLPSFIGQLVEAQLIIEMSLGHHFLLEDIVSSFGRCGTFQNPALRELALKAAKNLTEDVDNKLWGKNTSTTDRPDKKVDKKLARRSKTAGEPLTLEQIQDLLNEEGYGWTARLPHLASKGILGAAKMFYVGIFPELQKRAQGDPEVD
jgi:transcriptional regulator with XRE-family HTH domain